MKCEFCGVDENKTENFLHEAKYYYIHDMNLCMRCVDKLNSYRNYRDINEYWTEADAKNDGFPVFPYHKLRDIKRRTQSDVGELERINVWKALRTMVKCEQNNSTRS